MTDTTGAKLLPCPFCGSEDLHTDFHRHHGVIACKHCEAMLPLPEKSPETQAARWNERPLAAQPSAGAQVDLQAVAKVAAERAGKNASVAPQLLFAHILWAMQDAGLVTPAQPDTGDVAALREALEPFAEMADKFAGSMVEVCHPHPDNPSPTIQPLPVAYLERAKQTLAALSKPNAPGREG